MSSAPRTFDALRRTTPARLAVGRAGTRPRTETLLKFRLDHSAARDAVWTPWTPAFIDGVRRAEWLIVSSAAADRRDYIVHPDHGRALVAGAAEQIAAASASRSRQTDRPLVQIVLSDGLSPVAAERHFAVIAPRLLDLLERLGDIAVPVAVINGRVAIGDAIACAAGADLIVHLIGERPGLAVSDSLGCYLTYRPNAATTDADRKCISNIHPAGLNPAEAAAAIAGLAQRILAAGTSGTDLVC